MQPHHIHDCDRCQFLGAVPGPRGPVDLYRCNSKPGVEGRTYVARFSSDGPDYSSAGSAFLEKVPGFAEFARVAMVLDTVLPQDT